MENIKKIAVCGDSFFSCDTRWPNTHFSELLSNSLNATLYNYARQGTSVNVIRLQLEEAVKQKPDLILFGSTDIHRFEIPLISLYPQDNFSTYNISYGLHNIEYRHYPNSSKFQVDGSKATLFSDHWSKFLCEDNFPSDVIGAWKNYLSFLYDSNWKQQIDQWIIESGIYFLDNCGIPYFYMPNGNFVPQNLNKNKLIDYKINDDESPRSYHTLDNEQEKIFLMIKGKINEIHHCGF
jgi:hypothetical protein